MAVMEGLALAAWRHVRATRDVDLLIGVSEADLEPLLSTLISAGLLPKHQPLSAPIGQQASTTAEDITLGRKRGEINHLTKIGAPKNLRSLSIWSRSSHSAHDLLQFLLIRPVALLEHEHFARLSPPKVWY
jgi:hypothetical protein